MMMISLPKGESFDTAVLKLAEESPGFRQWNTMNKQYEEPLPGTGQGTLWVEFTRINR
jgi:hypothetical protein